MRHVPPQSFHFVFHTSCARACDTSDQSPMTIEECAFDIGVLSCDLRHLNPTIFGVLCEIGLSDLGFSRYFVFLIDEGVLWP